ncbi:hypothetical protein [Paenibacillus camelliae]|uniref:hypothetical protein n=1 Tax=Paenibacillus camelliae TaxID=512410 RepID=UPI002041D3EC|nr:hypothetical protein [Paenibacillus camelliae]MCM3634362.1 hypothetical protein [Paenibacillus camelliae]
MNIRKPMLYCAAFIVCITLLVGCGEEEQAASSTFFDAIEASASESKKRTASAQFDDEAGERQQTMQLGLETEKEEAVNLELEKRDEGQQQDASMHDAAKEQLNASTTDAVDHSRIENKNQTVEMSLKEIQARKMSAAAAEQAEGDQIEAGSEAVSDTTKGTLSGKSSNISSGKASSPRNDEKTSAVNEEFNSTPVNTPSGKTSNNSPSSAANDESINAPSDVLSSNATSSKSSDTSSTVSTKGKNEIYWSEFFDNEDQTTPSNTFWDLSEKSATVQIKGFMGEVLSLDKNWFLLIPEPGAECPFDNGDETYWNKIMIVFVDEDVKLRYTSKPLQLTGKLDVGIKVDESGYKTMFRLYDATFTEI